jgi:putative ABC transport system substrate-binding protein
MAASEVAVRRREFITLIGSVAVWPAAAIAQQNNEKRLVGIITGFNDKETAPFYAAFRMRLRELGWIEGQNVAFDVGHRPRTAQHSFLRADCA